jgi:autophagy-related protein 13
MHQLPRPLNRGGAAAASNAQRPTSSSERPPMRSRSSQDLVSYTERAQQDTGLDALRQGPGSTALDKETQKLHQIVQVGISTRLLYISADALPELLHQSCLDHLLGSSQSTSS